jgi:hypothetical protein
MGLSLVIARFFMRVYMRQSQLFISDFWLGIAALNTINYVVLGTLVAKWGGFDDHVPSKPKLEKVASEFVFSDDYD